MTFTKAGYYWDRAVWGEIPGIAFHREVPAQPPVVAGHMPLSNEECAGCKRPMAQALVDAGEHYHITCGPPRLPMVRP